MPQVDAHGGPACDSFVTNGIAQATAWVNEPPRGIAISHD